MFALLAELQEIHIHILGGDAPVPFNTQFFNDDDDGPAFDDLYDGDVDGDGAVPEDAGEQDLLAAAQSMTRRVRPESVNYAKRAKRVDVRKLKENIWRGLDIKISQKAEQEEEGMVTVLFHDACAEPSLTCCRMSMMNP